MTDCNSGRIISLKVECGCCGLVQEIEYRGNDDEFFPYYEDETGTVHLDYTFKCIRCGEENFIGIE